MKLNDYSLCTFKILPSTTSAKLQRKLVHELMTDNFDNFSMRSIIFLFKNVIIIKRILA